MTVLYFLDGAVALIGTGVILMTGGPTALAVIWALIAGFALGCGVHRGYVDADR